MARKSIQAESPPEVDEVTEQETVKVTKSIVPAKYAGRYKAGGSDALAEFIKAQSAVESGFSFPNFFELCRRNGIPEDKVAHYEQQVADKRHGAQGRARMTLRNMLATFARKNGELVGLDGSSTSISLPKPTLSGAAKKAKEGEGVEASTY